MDNPGQPQVADPSERRNRRGRGGLYARRILVALVLLPVIAIAAGLLVLQIPSVSTSVVNTLARRLSPWTTSNLSVASARIKGFGNIVLEDVRLVNDRGTAMATIDTASLHIRPLALLRRAVIISNARIVGADVILTQRADSVWDLLEPFVDPDPEEGEPREIRIDNAEVVKSRVEAHYLASADSVLRIESINLRLPYYAAGPQLRVRLDTIAALIYPASRPRTAASLNGKLLLERGTLTADSLRLVSDSSNVLVNGTLVLPAGDEKAITDIDFRVDAQPLDFRDIGALVPGFDVPGSLRLSAHVTGTSQNMEFAADGRSFDGGTIKAVGRIDRNPADSVRYIIDAEVRGVDPHLWAASAPSSRVDADAQVTLTGASPESVDGHVEASIGRTPVGSVVILPTTVNARFDNGTAFYTVHGGVEPWASIDGSGRARPFDKRISADFAGNVRQLRDTSFGTVTVTGVAGFVRATWRNRTLDARANIADAVVRGVRIDTANATINYARDNASVVATGATTAGDFTIDAFLRDLDRSRSWKVNILKLSRFDLARIDTAYPRTTLNAVASGTGHGFDPAQIEADMNVNLAPSVLNGEAIDTAAFHATLDQGTLALNGSAAAPRGRAVLAGTIEPFSETRPFQIARMRFSDVVVDTAADGRPILLSGALAASGTLPSDTFPSITGTITIDPARINNGRLASGHASFAMVDDSAHADVIIRTGEGNIDVTAVAQLARSSDHAIRIARGRAEGTAHLPDLDEFAGNDSAGATLDARFTIDADGTDPHTMAWTANVNANGKYATAVVDTLTLRARIASGILHLDTLLLRSNVATGDGAGTLAIAEGATAPDSARLHVRIDADSAYDVDQLLPLQNFSLRGGHLVLDATNSNGGIDATTTVTVLGLISPGAWADSMQLNGSARLERLKPTAIKATFAGNDLGYGTVEIAAASGNVDYDTEEAKFDIAITGDASHTLKAEGTVFPSKSSLTFGSMVIQVDTAPWKLSKAASITFGERIAVTDFSLERGSRRITIDGVLDRAGEQDFLLVLDSVPVRGFAEFAGLQGADGMLDGAIRLRGPANDIAINTDMGLVFLGTRGRILLSQAPGARLTVRANLTDSLQKTLQLDGSIPLSVSIAPGDSTPIEGNGPLALTVRSDSFSIGWLTPITRLYGITRMGGALRSQIDVTGTFADPAMSGTASLLAASVEYPRQGIAYRNVNGDFTLGGDRVHVNSLTAVAEGTATLTGDVVMETAARPTLAIDATFDGFRAANNEWTRLAISGNARMTGEILAPSVSGRIRLVDTDLFADPVGKTSGGSAVVLTEEDFRMLKYYFGYDATRIRQQSTSLIDPWTMDLQITLGADTWLRRRRAPEMSIQLDGSLDVKKAAGDSIQLFGNINVLPQRSYFEQFGRRFEVASGSVAFNGPMMQWNANFNANYNVPSRSDPGAAEVVITLDVQGGIDDLKVTLGADPAMETADVLSYLATGRPASSAAEFGGSELADVGANVAASQLSSVIEDATRKSIGLDVVEVRHNGIEGATIVAGRYVNPRLFVGFEQPLMFKSENDEQQRRAVEQATQVQLEYRLYRWLLASLEGSQSNFSALFRIRRAF